MKNRIMIFALAALGCATTGHAFADYANHPDAIRVADELAEEGLDRERVLSLLASAQKQEKILELIARPAEKTLTWADYRSLFVQPDRVEFHPDFAGKVNVVDADLQRYYQDNSDRFRSIENADVEYLVLDVASIQKRIELPEVALHEAFTYSIK